MKRISIGLLLSIFSLNLFCQLDHEMLPDSTYTYGWDSEANDWVVLSRYVYTCYPAGYDIIQNSWDSETNDWDWSEDSPRTTRTYYAFNVHGDIIEEAEYFWDSETNDWNWLNGYIKEREFIYVDNGNKTERIIGNYLREVYTYDSTGNLIEKASYYRHYETDDWEGMGRDWSLDKRCYDCSDRCDNYYDVHYNVCCKWGRWVYVYDSFGNQIESIWYDWDYMSKQWVDPTSNIFTYDSYGNLIKEIGYRHWSGGMGWSSGLYNIRIDYKYDSNGNPTEKMFYLRDSETDDWGEEYRDIFEYDAKGNVSEKIHYKWDSETNDWVNSRKIISYWPELTTSMGTNSDNQKCIIYPNPTYDQITIESMQSGHHSIRITSLNGQLIHSEDMEGTSHQIDLSSFQKGVYLITIRSEDFVTTRKIIKL